MKIDPNSLGYYIVFTIVCYLIAANTGPLGEFLWYIYGGIMVIGIVAKLIDSDY